MSGKWAAVWKRAAKNNRARLMDYVRQPLRVVERVYHEAPRHNLAELGVAHPIVPILAQEMWHILEETPGAAHYIELALTATDDAGQPHGLTLTLQRHEGKTPHQLRRAAETEVAQLRLLVQQLEEEAARDE